MDSVVAHLRLRMAKMKCVTLPSEADRERVDAAVQEAQQLGATVSKKTLRHQGLKMLMPGKVSTNLKVPLDSSADGVHHFVFISSDFTAHN